MGDKRAVRGEDDISTDGYGGVHIQHAPNEQGNVSASV